MNPPAAITEARKLPVREAMKTSFSHPIHLHPTMIVGYSMVFLGSGLLVAAASLADVTGTEKYILISLAASVIASSTAFLANERESLRMTTGRALFSGVAGLVTPMAAAHFSDVVAGLLTLSVIMVFGASFASALVAYFISIPFISWIKRRAPRVVSWGDRYIPEQEFIEPEEVDPADIRHARGGGKRK